jgi:hypothetical protein
MEKFIFSSTFDEVVGVGENDWKNPLTATSKRASMAEGKLFFLFFFVSLAMRQTFSL